MTKKELEHWNQLVREAMSEGRSVYCKGCYSLSPTKDYKAIAVRVEGFRGILLGGCNKCAAQDTRAVLDYMSCRGEIEPCREPVAAVKEGEAQGE